MIDKIVGAILNNLVPRLVEWLGGLLRRVAGRKKLSKGNKARNEQAQVIENLRQEILRADASGMDEAGIKAIKGRLREETRKFNSM